MKLRIKRSMKGFFIRALAALMVALACAPALAAESAQPEPVRLAPVVVTAGRVAEKPENVTQTVTVIPQEEIRKSQTQDLGGLLRNYGVQIDSFTPNSSLSSIAIRGVRSSPIGTDLAGSVLILVNGRRAGTDNVSMIPMVNVERVEIIRGPAAVQYGTSAVGGVVNIITRRGMETTSALAEVGAGSFDAFKAQAEASGAKAGFDVSGGFSYMNMHDYSIGDDGGKYDNTGLNYKVGYSANLGYTFLEEHRLGFSILGTRLDDAGSPNYYSDLRPNDWNDRSNGSADVMYEGGYKDWGLSWMARYYNGRDHYLNDSPDPDRWGYSMYFRQDTDYQGAQAQASFSRSILTLTGGVDWLNYKTEQSAGYYPGGNTSKYYNTGYFLLAKLAFFEESLIISGGLRYDDYTLKAQGKDDDLDNTTPSVGIAWHALDWLTLRANYGESYRLPTTQEFLGFPAWGYIGNSNLKPEKGQSWDAGFEINHQGLNAGLTYFQTHYKDKIAAQPIPGTYDSQYVNLGGTTKYRGLEFQAGYDLGGLFDWPFMLRPYVSLTKMLQYDDQNGNKLKNVSDLDLAAGLNFEYPEIGLSADLRVIYYGEQNQTDFTETSPTYYQTVRVGGKATVDLYVSQRIHAWEDGGALSVKAEVRNLFDIDYETINDYPMPGRLFYLGLRYDY